ncbi:MAG: hypothetical protein RR603_01390 [Kurthia sp.]
MDQLPDKLIKLDQIRIERGMGKICKCVAKKFVIDTDNRRVTCSSCGAQLDAFDAMYAMASDWERIQKEMEIVFEQRKALNEYKPHLRIIKELESKTRTGPNKMHPICPACEEPFALEELTRFYGAKFVNAQILERIDRMKKERQPE